MRCLVLLLMSCFLSASAKAQDGAREVSYDAFGVPEQTVKVIEAAPRMHQTVPDNFPSCDDSALLEGVRRAMSEDEDSLGDESISARRARLLALKNINNFSALDVDAFRPDDNYELANILIAAKINGGLSNADFRICASDNPVLRRRIFLLLRESEGSIRVDVVNYRPGAVPSFVYKK